MYGHYSRVHLYLVFYGRLYFAPLKSKGGGWRTTSFRSCSTSILKFVCASRMPWDLIKLICAVAYCEETWKHFGFHFKMNCHCRVWSENCWVEQTDTIIKNYMLKCDLSKKACAQYKVKKGKVKYGAAAVLYSRVSNIEYCQHKTPPQRM